MNVEGFFSSAREVAHAAIAVIGTLTASAALVATLLSVCGLHVTDLQVVQSLGEVGAAVALLSKLIDSVHSAITSGYVGGAK